MSDVVEHREQVDAGAAWLGLQRLGGDAEAGVGRWALPVTPTVISGASALFGGCATAAALVAAADLAPQPVVWCAAHFGSLAKLGTTLELEARTIAAGRTMSHLEVRGVAQGRESFVVRVAAGRRPDHQVEGQWVRAPDVPPPGACDPFPLPVHDGTWAARFDWRLAGSSSDADREPWAAWWVRPVPDAPAPPPLVAVPVLADYITYGVGRALGRPMGGLSIDNVLRLHHIETDDADRWTLLEVRPAGIAGGFGHGEARVFGEGTLRAVGSQSMVMNDWDWRLPSERRQE